MIDGYGNDEETDNLKFKNNENSVIESNNVSKSNEVIIYSNSHIFHENSIINAETFAKLEQIDEISSIENDYCEYLESSDDEVKQRQENKEVDCISEKHMEETVPEIELEDHLRIHYNNASEQEIELYTCELCGKMFKNQKSIELHVIRIHSDTKLICTKCDKTFSNERKFKYHLLSHEKRKKYQCPHCDKSFLQRHHLTDHERMHSGAKPYLCNICGKNFRTKCALTRHSELHDKNNLKERYLCNICGKKYFHLSSYRTHLKLHDDERPYKCNDCGKKFALKNYLKQHMIKHTGIKPFQCDQCNATFSVANAMKWHMQSVHKGPIILEMHDCSICNKKFQSASTLASHTKTHLDVRNYICTECGDGFKSEKHLQIHKNVIHLKLKSYSCNVSLYFNYVKYK